MTITISECPTLELILRNDVLSKQGGRQGYYHYNGLVNGRHSWKSADQAIWYIPEVKSWGIGPLKIIGESGFWITSSSYKDESLFSVPSDKWQYADIENNKWIDIKSGDISIICVKGNKAKKFPDIRSNEMLTLLGLTVCLRDTYCT